MRGLLIFTHLYLLLSGITPAHAGLTYAQIHRGWQSRDHPRACGAYIPSLSKLTAPVGSPPRMRGLPEYTWSRYYVPGITPAHAGLTQCNESSSPRFWDHPRACGAYSSDSVLYSSSTGSPPRMRGLHSQTSLQLRPCGITPAHAGLTGLRCDAKQRLRDHPRACGAYPCRL